MRLIDKRYIESEKVLHEMREKIWLLRLSNFFHSLGKKNKKSKWLDRTLLSLYRQVDEARYLLNIEANNEPR